MMKTQPGTEDILPQLPKSALARQSTLTRFVPANSSETETRLKALLKWGFILLMWQPHPPIAFINTFSRQQMKQNGFCSLLNNNLQDEAEE